LPEDAKEVVRVARKVGYPVIIKAARVAAAGAECGSCIPRLRCSTRSA